MSFRGRFRNIPKYFSWGSLIIGSVSMVTFQITQTYKKFSSIVKTGAIDKGNESYSQYIYVEDPFYEMRIKEQQENEKKLFGYYALWWQKIKQSIALRLLDIAQNGNKPDQEKAVEWLAKIKNLEDWDYLTIGQSMDAKTAVGLARTPGTDLRFFLPPSKYLRSGPVNPDVLESSSLTFPLRDLLKALTRATPHSCINYFLKKHFINFKDLSQFDYNDATSTGISTTDKSLTLQCLNAILHHLSATSGEFNFEKAHGDDRSIFPIRVENYEAIKKHLHLLDIKKKGLSSTQLAAKHRLLFFISNALYQYPNETDYQIICAKLMSRLSMHNELLEEFFQNGLIGYLANWLRSPNIRLSALAAQSLANLDDHHYEKYGFYHPNIYLLHPMYRIKKTLSCDVVFTHGLLGGVFFTWRQRDCQGDKDKNLAVDNKNKMALNNRAKPKGTRSSKQSNDSPINFDGNNQVYRKQGKIISDPDSDAIMEDMDELERTEWESIGSEFEFILHDIPESAVRDPGHEYVCERNENVCAEELEDKNCYTGCWPKDWLPNDVKNVRVLGVSYETALSEWTAKCPLEAGQGAVDGSLSARARYLGFALRGAGVGDNRVIVWISHSMGGLIIKQILMDADEMEVASSWSHTGLAHWTRALAFYSTPHLGSSLATAAAKSVAISSVLWPSRDVQELKGNSKTLLELHNKWVTVAKLRNWEVVGFAESLPLLVSSWRLPITLVGLESADAGIGTHYAMPLDHLSICKPATRHSFLYHKVLEIVCHASGVKCSNSICGQCKQSQL